MPIFAVPEPHAIGMSLPPMTEVAEGAFYFFRGEFAGFEVFFQKFVT